MYRKTILPILFLFDPEKVHNFTFLFFKISLNLPFIGFIIRKIYSVENKKLHKKIFGLKFNNPSAKGSCGCKTSFMYEHNIDEQKSEPSWMQYL